MLCLTCVDRRSLWGILARLRRGFGVHYAGRMGVGWCFGRRNAFTSFSPPPILRNLTELLRSSARVVLRFLTWERETRRFLHTTSSPFRECRAFTYKTVLGAEWSPRVPLARHFGCPEARPPRERYPECPLRPHPACIFIQHHYMLWLRPMLIGLETARSPVLTHRDAQSWIWVSENTTSRQLVNRDNLPHIQVLCLLFLKI